MGCGIVVCRLLVSLLVIVVRSLGKDILYGRESPYTYQVASKEALMVSRRVQPAAQSRRAHNSQGHGVTSRLLTKSALLGVN